MADTEHADLAPEDTGEGVQLPQGKGRRAFRHLRRELSDEEFSSPAAQRMLLDDLERLEGENASLVDYRDRYYEADKRAAVLAEKLKVHIASDVVFGVCLTVGAGLLSTAPALWSAETPYGHIFVVMGFVLILGGIASRAAVKR